MINKYPIRKLGAQVPMIAKNIEKLSITDPFFREDIIPKSIPMIVAKIVLKVANSKVLMNLGISSERTGAPEDTDLPKFPVKTSFT